ncbi:MAG: deoxyribodipyrimidine photo-lyase [Paracoccaceae bacterium]|nr:deoxyribodipyrimidine photo-lyase [Paracoccaceae bacterium]
MNVLVWFKRDLRVEDHPALRLAAEMGPVLPVYIVEPELWRQPDASARQWAFISESLVELREALGALGAPLSVRVGEAVAVLDKLCRLHDIGQIVSHEETGTLWTFARDRAVADWARRTGVKWTELPQQGVVRRLPARGEWGRRRDAFLALGPQPAPADLTPVPGVEPGAIPTARALRLTEDRCPHRQLGGRARGLELVDSFLTLRGRPYRAAMSSPVSGERACSRLSPHLAWGTLSGREVATALDARMAERPGPGWGASLSSFRSRLAWRDHFIQKLEDRPDMEAACLHPAYEGLRPRTPDASRLAAWEAGETGLPFVDACMRYLRATGWLNFRMRSMVVSIATQHLWLDWREIGGPLARLFTDYEPGIHWPQVQMQAGVTGMNTIRIYNPVKQGQDQDPTGAFTRRWVPELADVPDAFLQDPWRWSGAGTLRGRRYPEPVVDPVASARAAREAVHAVRRTEGFRDEAKRLVVRMSSGNGARPRGRKARALPGQMDLGL